MGLSEVTEEGQLCEIVYSIGPQIIELGGELTESIAYAVCVLIIGVPAAFSYRTDVYMSTKKEVDGYG